MTPSFTYLLSGVSALLLIATIIGQILHRLNPSKTVTNLNDRIRAWWIMVIVFCISLFIGKIATIVLFLLISFLAFREFITLVPTNQSDHRALFWAFFIILPLNYLLIAIHWYGLFLIFIPVYGFVFIPIRKALSGNTRNYLASTALIQWGMLVCVYFVSHVPLILSLNIPELPKGNGALLFFFVLAAQLSDVLQYVWGKCIGKHPIVPTLSPNKTWEGFLGGIGTTVATCTCLWWATPFNPWQAALMALLVCLFGFAGGLVMSAIKRDLGVKDWGTSITGHGGFMDRIDSLCFAAPLFFHLTGFFFANGMNEAPPLWLTQ